MVSSKDCATQESETLKSFLTGPMDRGRVAVGAGGCRAWGLKGTWCGGGRPGKGNGRAFDTPFHWGPGRGGLLSVSMSPHVGARARCWRLGAWRLSPHACFMSPPPQQIFPLDCSPRVGEKFGLLDAWLLFALRLGLVAVRNGVDCMKIRSFEIMYFIHSSEPSYS